MEEYVIYLICCKQSLIPFPHLTLQVVIVVFVHAVLSVCITVIVLALHQIIRNCGSCRPVTDGRSTHVLEDYFTMVVCGATRMLVCPRMQTKH